MPAPESHGEVPSNRGSNDEGEVGCLDVPLEVFSIQPYACFRACLKKANWQMLGGAFEWYAGKESQVWSQRIPKPNSQTLKVQTQKYGHSNPWVVGGQGAKAQCCSIQGQGLSMGSSFESWQQSGARCSYKGLASKRNVVSQPPFSRGLFLVLWGVHLSLVSFKNPPNTLALEVFWSSNTDPPSANGRELTEGI